VVGSRRRQDLERKKELSMKEAKKMKAKAEERH
jgi:hypothetical protein